MSDAGIQVARRRWENRQSEFDMKCLFVLLGNLKRHMLNHELDAIKMETPVSRVFNDSGNKMRSKQAPNRLFSVFHSISANSHQPLREEACLEEVQAEDCGPRWDGREAVQGTAHK